MGWSRAGTKANLGKLASQHPAEVAEVIRDLELRDGQSGPSAAELQATASQGGAR